MVAGKAVIQRFAPTRTDGPDGCPVAPRLPARNRPGSDGDTLAHEHGRARR